jgi:hypothetical protein
MGVPGFRAEKLPTSTGIGPSQMALGVAMADVRLARVSGDYGQSVVSDSISGVLAAIHSSDRSGQPKSHTTNVPEIVRDGHMTANDERPVQEQPVMTDTPDVAYAQGK